MDFKKVKNDILLVMALLVLGGGVWLCMRLSRREGGYVTVEVDGNVVMTRPLDTDFEGVIGEGGHSNTLVICGGWAWVSEASCPDKVCVDRGRVRYDGETIVCLPNKLVVTVSGGESRDVDAVSG